MISCYLIIILNLLYIGYQQGTGPPTSAAFVQPVDYGTSSSITPMQPNIPHQQIIVIGGCPACRVGILLVLLRYV